MNLPATPNAYYRWVIVAADGLIYDLLGSYGWLYIGASALGIGAFLMAMTFKSVP